EWVHVQLHQQKGMISLSPPTICNSADGLNYWAIRVLGYAICHPFNCDNAELIYRIKHFFIC
ncbi:hypothetical protein RNN08_15560, partial [Escherichia coli]|nr:hypothetical protein [Escherichia coli]